MATSATHPAPLARAAIRRHHPRQEPSAVVPHAGICAGGGPNPRQGPSLPRQADFLGFSYGFRPGRFPHDALDALAVGITRKKVNWVLDADFREFFTSIDHRWLARFLEHRIADKRVLRLIQKWMAAGVIEDGAWTESQEGVPQGASASPLLANVYLHYVFDLWAHQWRTRHARGDVVLMRFADLCRHPHRSAYAES